MAQQYKVQVGFGDKGRYKDRYTFDEGPGCIPGSVIYANGRDIAWYYFNCINIGKGYKKRLILVSDQGRITLIARQTS